MESMTQTLVLITGIVQTFKKAGMPTRYLPLVAVLIGILLTAAPYLSSPIDRLVAAVCEGAIYGLTASGMIGVIDDRLEKATKSTVQIDTSESTNITKSNVSVDKKKKEKQE